MKMPRPLERPGQKKGLDKSFYFTKLDMARTRNLKPGFFVNEDLADLHPLARLAFAGLWCHADREGRLEDRPRRLKPLILPYDDCDFDQLLQSLADSPGKFLVRYEVSGQKYIEIPKFSAHQNPHCKETESTIPPPPGSNTTQAPFLHGTATVQEPLQPGLPPSSLFLPPSPNHLPPSSSSCAKQDDEEVDVWGEVLKLAQEIDKILFPPPRSDGMQYKDTEFWLACSALALKFYERNWLLDTARTVKERFDAGRGTDRRIKSIKNYFRSSLWQKMVGYSFSGVVCKEETVKTVWNQIFNPLEKQAREFVASCEPIAVNQPAAAKMENQSETQKKPLPKFSPLLKKTNQIKSANGGEFEQILDGLTLDAMKNEPLQ